MLRRYYFRGGNKKGRTQINYSGFGPFGERSSCAFFRLCSIHQSGWVGERERDRQEATRRERCCKPKKKQTISKETFHSFPSGGRVCDPITADTGQLGGHARVAVLTSALWPCRKEETPRQKKQNKPIHTRALTPSWCGTQRKAISRLTSGFLCV